MKKRILSAILVLCMAISLLPASALASEELDVLNYVFTSGAFGGSSSVSLKTASVGYNDIVESVSDQWEFVGITGGSGYFKSTGLNYSISSSLGQVSDNGIIFKVNVGAGGAFVPKIGYGTNRYGGILSVYMIPVSEADSWDTSSSASVSYDVTGYTPIAEIDTYDPSVSSTNNFSEEMTLDMVELEQQEYYVVFAIDGANSEITSTSRVFLIKSLELKHYGYVESASLSADKTEIPCGRQAKLDMHTVYSTGESVEIATENIVYSVSDDSIAMIDDNGTVTALREGITTITAEANFRGVALFDQIQITVTPAPVLDSIQAEIDFEDILVGDSTQISLAGVMDDGIAADMSQYPVSFKSYDEEVASVSEDGTIIGLSEGKTQIEATTFSENGNKLSSVITVNVYDEIQPTVIDFKQTTVSTSDRTKPEQTPGYEITAFGRSYFIKTSSYLRVGTQRLWPAVSETSTFGIKVKIPFDGVYNVELRGCEYVSGYVFSVFIDETYLGDIDQHDVLTQLNSVYLEKGEHEILFHSRTGNYAYLGLDTLSFMPYSGDLKLSRIEAELPSELAVGEIYSGEATAYMTDGSVHRFGINSLGESDSENYFTAETSSDALSISGFEYSVGSDGKINYTITGTSAGIADITLTAALGEDVETKSASVRVVEDNIGSADVHLDVGKVFVGDTVNLIPVITLESGRVISNESVEITFESLNPDIAIVSGSTLEAVSIGVAQIQITATFNGITKSGVSEVEVLPEGMTDIDATAGGSRYIKIGDSVPLYVSATSNEGNDIYLENAGIFVEVLTPETVSVDSDLNITGISEGEAMLNITVVAGGRTRTKGIFFNVIKDKSSGAYITEEKVAAIRENVKKYDWAAAEKEQYVQKAEKYVDKAELLYNLIPSEGMPRSSQVGLRTDPERYICRYCGTDLYEIYGAYPWIVDPINRPWKIQCPYCKRLFPSNDFESFYELGLDESGKFNRELATARNNELVNEGHSGYLVNTLYPELHDGINVGKGLREGETAETWGVDDGFGYAPKKPDGTPYEYDNGVEERHTYIAYYQHWGLWYSLGNLDNSGVITDAVKSSAKAYLYTGDLRYGRTAAILLDRIADVYPDYDLNQYEREYSNSDGGTGTGKILGCVYEGTIAKDFAEAYDSVYDVYGDSQVAEFLKEKSIEYKTSHSKDSPAQLRTNVEDGILREIFEAATEARISGNMGMHQSAVAVAATVLDNGWESRGMLDWIFKYSETDNKTYNTGGGFSGYLINDVDRDGMGYEASPGYNAMWIKNMINAAKTFAGFDGYDLFRNPKYAEMFVSQLPLILVGTHTAQIGDSGSTAGLTFAGDINTAVEGFKHLKDTQWGETLAKYIYLLNGKTVEGLHYDATTKNPESIQAEITAIIEEVGTAQESELLSGYGFAVLRRGNEEKNLRDFWMGFGRNSGHGHYDTLNLGIEAFGLNLSSDLGYPALMGYDPNRLQWVSSTLSHNTVLVDEKENSNSIINGKPIHFDAAENVQVMDVSAPEAVTGAEEYRRTVVMVDVGDDVSYGIDFFRVKGGSKHTYSFHAQSDEISSVGGMRLVAQSDSNGDYVGSYAGADVPYGPDPNTQDLWSYETLYPRGYTWLNNVLRAKTSEKLFFVDFAIKDYNNAVSDSENIHLRMTQVNDFIADEVALMNGYAPPSSANANITALKYMLVQRSGENLDSLFTTVIEPYKGSRYIRSIKEIDIISEDGDSSENEVKAVKISRVDGRVDYIVYATNNNTLYTITDGDFSFDFRGFVGVYSVDSNGDNIYKYVNDGDVIGENTGAAAQYSGRVKDFTKSLEEENYIDVSFASEVLADSLAGRYVHIENDASQNAVYYIEEAEDVGNGTMRLHVGTKTLIRSFKDVKQPELGYVYNIAEGQMAVVPLSYEEDYAPVFDAVGEVVAFAGKPIKLQVRAESPTGKTLTYIGNNLPEGATIDSESGLIAWTPTDAQVGKNSIEINATDSSGKSETLRFTVNVVGISPVPAIYNGSVQEPEFTDGFTPDSVTYTYIFNGETVDKAVDAGEYTVLAAVEMNGSVQIVRGTYTISPAPITVRARDVVMTRGEEVPELTWILTQGRIYGDDLLDGELTANKDTYQIEQGTLENKNYDITFIPGTLTVYGKVEQPELQDPPEIKEDEETGDKYIEIPDGEEKIKFEINLDAPGRIDGSVLAAVFNKHGVLLEIRRFKASEVLEIMLDRTDGKYIKVFWWSDDNFKPHIHDKKYGIR